MNRRIFLKGVGGAAIAAPFLGSLLKPARAQEAAAPKRLVIYYTNNGCLTNRWFPKVLDGSVTPTTLEGTTLAGLSTFAPKLLFPRGLGMQPRPQFGFGGINVDGANHFDPHDQGMASKLTCAPIDPNGSHWALSHSLDWEVARAVNTGTKSPLVLSVTGSGTDVKRIISYSASREPYAPETNPQNVYASLTGLFQGEETEADYRVARGQSIIDLVSDDLETLQRKNMSNADQRRLKDWLDLLRDTENRVIPAACNADSATELGITEATVAAAGGFSGGTAAAFTTRGDMMIRLIALSMMCDNNRSIILQWPGYVRFEWDGLSHEYDHHGLSHRVGSAAVSGTCVPGVIDRIHEIDLWYAGRYAELVTLLDSIVEGDETMLDHCACMWLPELADGNAHNNNNLPIVIAGGCSGYLKTGVSVNVSTDTNLATGNSEASCGNTGFEEVGQGSGSPSTGSTGGNVPLNKLYVTLLNAVGALTTEGAPYDRFGAVDTGADVTTDGNGNIVDGVITNPGELSALRA